MDIKSKDRLTLKGYFKKNSIPTESNFADLIDGMLNFKEDGIVKLPNDPLCIAAADTGAQKLINFYGSFDEANPAWTFQLNPRPDQNSAANAKPGFSISDGQGVSRLFIDKNTGNVGIGTLIPNGKLDVFTGGAGAWNRFVVNTTTQWGDGNAHVTIGAGGASGIMLNNPHVPWFAAENRASIRLGKSGGVSSGAYWDIGTRANNAFSILRDNSLIGLYIDSNGNVGIGTSMPQRKLQVGDDVNGLGFDVGTSPDAGIFRFGDNTGWKLHFGRSREKSNGTLNTGITGALMTIKDNGNIGIGIINPEHSLDVKGSAIRLSLENNGGGQLRITNDTNDNKIYLEAFSKDGSTHASEFLLTGRKAENVPKLTLRADITRIMGNVMVRGDVLCDIDSPLADTNYKIELVGSAFESTEGNNTYLKINDVSMNMTASRGLNTVVLKPDGSFKNSVTHDVYANAATWNTWADWVNTNAQNGDIVAVASFDAIKNAPRGGTAETLLNNIGVERAFSAVTVSDRTPYTLLFIKGGGIAQEVVSPYKGTNAHLTTISCNLLTRQNQWRDAVLQNSWVRYDTIYNPPQYFKDSNGIVWLRGLIRSGTAGSTIFVLPESYRPSNRQLHVVAAHDPTNIIGNANNGVGRIDILPDGRVLHVSGNNGWIALDSIAFRSYITPVFIFTPPPIVIIEPLKPTPIIINPPKPTPIII